MINIKSLDKLDKLSDNAKNSQEKVCPNNNSVPKIQFKVNQSLFIYQNTIITAIKILLKFPITHFFNN